MQAEKTIYCFHPKHSLRIRLVKVKNTDNIVNIVPMVYCDGCHSWLPSKDQPAADILANIKEKDWHGKKSIYRTASPAEIQTA